MEPHSSQSFFTAHLWGIQTAHGVESTMLDYVLIWKKAIVTFAHDSNGDDHRNERLLFLQRVKCTLFIAGEQDRVAGPSYEEIIDNDANGGLLTPRCNAKSIINNQIEITFLTRPRGDTEYWMTIAFTTFNNPPTSIVSMVFTTEYYDGLDGVVVTREMPFPMNYHFNMIERPTPMLYAPLQRVVKPTNTFHQNFNAQAIISL